MVGEFWQQAVEVYLAIDRGLFLNPEYLIGTPPPGWYANADFLAICFPERKVWMVEVTTNAAGLNSKINEFSDLYETRIREQLIRHQVIPKDVKDWKFGFWAFVPEQDCEKVRARLTGANLQFQVTPLEDTVKLSAKPSAWDQRFR